MYGWCCVLTVTAQSLSDFYAVLPPGADCGSGWIRITDRDECSYAAAFAWNLTFSLVYEHPTSIAVCFYDYVELLLFATRDDELGHFETSRNSQILCRRQGELYAVLQPGDDCGSGWMRITEPQECGNAGNVLKLTYSEAYMNETSFAVCFYDYIQKILFATRYLEKNALETSENSQILCRRDGPWPSNPTKPNSTVPASKEGTPAGLFVVIGAVTAIVLCPLTCYLCFYMKKKTRLAHSARKAQPVLVGYQSQNPTQPLCFHQLHPATHGKTISARPEERRSQPPPALPRQPSRVQLMPQSSNCPPPRPPPYEGASSSPQGRAIREYHTEQSSVAGTRRSASMQRPSRPVDDTPYKMPEKSSWHLAPPRSGSSSMISPKKTATPLSPSNSKAPVKRAKSLKPRPTSTFFQNYAQLLFRDDNSIHQLAKKG